MTDTYQELYRGQLPTGTTTLYTATTASGTIIKHISVVNTSASGVQFQLFRDGTSAANAITPPFWQVPFYGQMEWDGTMALGSGNYLAGIAGTVSALTLTMDGDVVS